VTLFGIDIGGTKCAVIRAGPDERPEASERFPTTAPRETLERIVHEIERMHPESDPLFGIACGNPMDARAGIIQSPPNLPGWDNIPVTQILRKRFGGEAHLMNDANAGALAEWRWGAGRGARSVLFLTHGTGMGAGLILDGRLYEGATGEAGEVGHVRLSPEGPVGYGKAGSFEGWCSGGGIGRLAQTRAAELGGRLFENIPAEALTARHVAEAAERGDPEALRLLETSGTWLGRALAMLVDILNPERIVLGSVYARAGKFLKPAMERALGEEALPAARAACRIVPAELGEAIGDHAALAVALYRAGRLRAC
jgi:glucokinase